MALLNIKEPPLLPKSDKLAIGIDLGTTHSLVACDREGIVQVLKDQNGDELIPSVVRFLANNKIEVGRLAKEALAYDPHNTIVSVKRQLLKSSLPLALGEVSPIAVSSHILSKMLSIARYSDPNIIDAVITVPAYFDEAQRQATKEAAHLAGIHVLRLLNEPTAAALAYGLERDARGYCLIYDLGGGTFDVSVLELNQGVFEVLATGGDTALGGDDMDELVASWLLEKADLTQTAINYAALLMQARTIKETLSFDNSCSFTLENGFQGEMTRAVFDEMIGPLVERTLKICSQVLKDAKINKSAIEHVVLVGGATRVNCVEEGVAQFFGQSPLKDIDPDKVVAIGAAIQASLLSGARRSIDMLLLDVIPLSLGMEMMGGVVEKILMRNTPIPAVATESFTTYQDGQTGFTFHIVQGERELAKDCRSLAHFELTGLPAKLAGRVKVEVTFRVDVDGLLSVEAKELATQKQTHIEIKPTYGLSQEHIAEMIQDSITHAESDVHTKKYQEKTVQAEKLIAILEKIGDEKLLVRKTEIKNAMTSQDSKQLSVLMKEVESALEVFLQQRMNTNLQNAIVGQSLTEVEELFS